MPQKFSQPSYEQNPRRGGLAAKITAVWQALPHPWLVVAITVIAIVLMFGSIMFLMSHNQKARRQLVATTSSATGDPSNNDVAIDYAAVEERTTAGDAAVTSDNDDGTTSQAADTNTTSSGSDDDLESYVVNADDGPVDEDFASDATADTYDDVTDDVAFYGDDETTPPYVQTDDSTACKPASSPLASKETTSVKTKVGKVTPPVITGAANPQKRWLAETERVLAGSRSYVDQRVKARGNKKLAINLDIDNSSLQSYYDKNKPAIPATLALTRYAKSKGVYILFNTARPKSMRASTLGQLQRAGYKVDGLCMRSDGRDIVASKQYCRNWYKSRGYTLIANVGNNTTDFRGDGYDRAYALPSSVNGKWLP